MGRSDENIAEQYPNIFEGLQKDAAQNSWDARAVKKGSGWKLIFKYIHDRNILIIEDFGTKGMNEERWNAYQSLWDPMKAAKEGALGTRGQGKFLFHYFATDKLVLTESIDEEGNYRFSYGTSEEWDIDKKLEDFIPGAKRLDHQGTRIWIVNVKKEFREELLDYRKFMRYIAATWWEIIRNWDATFIVDFNGVERQVSLPEMSPIKKEKLFPDEKIKDLGKAKNLILRYCKDEVPEHLRGIAVQRGGMTILRLPVVAEETIKNKIYGYCNFDKDLEWELKKIELPNHFGFRNVRAWNHTKEHIRHKIDDFLLKITPRKKKIEVAASILEKAVKLVNDLIGDHTPELLSGPSHPHVDVPLPPPLRIGIFRPNQRKFEYNETLLINCEIVNDTRENRNLLLEITIRHKDGNIKHSSRYNLNIVSVTRKKIDIPLIDFDENNDKAGEYRGVAILTVPHTGEKIHKKGFIFYLHQEPPSPPPGRGKGKVFISSFQFLRGKKPDGTLHYFAKWRNLPINDKGVISIVGDHPDFVRIGEAVSSKKARNRETLLYCIKCGINEAFRKLLELRYVDNKLDLDEIQRIKNICDEMIYEGILRSA